MMHTGQPNLVSVIIPCYNQAHFLGDAIESARRQSHDAVEIIVVDDGSHDETALVAARYSDVRCLRQPNRGLSAARNAGYQQSHGEFIVFLDADDRLLPNALFTGISRLRAQPECAFAYGNVSLIARDGSPFAQTHEVAIRTEHYLAMLRGNFIWTPGTVIYRRWALEAAGLFTSGIDAAADYELNLRITRRFPACHNDEVVLEHRRHAENMTLNSAVMLRATITTLRRERQQLAGNKLYHQALREGIKAVQQDYGEALITEVRRELRVIQFRQAARDLFALFRYYPRGACKVCLPGRFWARLAQLRLARLSAEGAQ